MGLSKVVSEVLTKRGQTDSAFVSSPGSFEFSIGEAITLWCGQYVLLGLGDRVFLGQVDSAHPTFFYEHHTMGGSPFGLKIEAETRIPIGNITGRGRVLAEVDDARVDLDPDLSGCTGRATVEPAPDEVISAYFLTAKEKTEVPLLVGCALDAENPLPVHLNACGFARHTGFFGQSGSGKSFALGILLERLRFHTAANIVVLDPNGDFLRMKRELRDLGTINHHSNKMVFGVDEHREAVRLHAATRDRIRILSAEPNDDADRLLVRLSDLETAHQAMLLGLHPVNDAGEYGVLMELHEALAAGGAAYSVANALAFCRGKHQIDYMRTIARIENMELARLKVWSDAGAGETPLVDYLGDPNVQTLVIDLSNLDATEQSIVSAIVLRRVWELQDARRRNRGDRGTILVVDEAHRVFPAKPLSSREELTLTWGSRIAGEGRKYGAFLIAASQLPSKIHEHILTQCENVVLMKMLSQTDLATLAGSLGYVSESLLQRALSFQTGQALLVGRIVRDPCLVHFEGRMTQEGGGDMRIAWSPNPV